ncbi:hypothetical protein OG394_00470 [Kribbella sp. NBC_01245]|uniref:hypothetical protein n=1 Tax=Kribbella sp. NBC_01245 TaxID=2903578 RepID=UPI002E2B6805|nr:hypothetical protein [Kribbella sp. NBC_01245]
MRIRKLAITATLISVLALTGCGGSSNDGAADGAKDQGSTNSKSGQTGSGETDEQADGDTSRNGSEQRTSGDGEQTGTGEDDLDPSVVAYRKYRTVVDEMSASGGKDTSKLTTVAIGDLLNENQALAKFYGAKKVHTEGSTRIVWVKKMSISKTALTLQACIDISKVKTLDAKGKSALKPGAPSRFLDTAQMRQVKNKWWRASVSRTRAQDC